MIKLKWALLMILAVEAQGQADQDPNLMKVEGWARKYSVSPHTKPASYHNRTLSIRQQYTLDTLVQWIATSYHPRGCYADIRKQIVALPDADNMPLTYRATAFNWSLYMKDGKPAPIQETEIPFTIAINAIPGPGIPFLNQDDIFWFHQPETPKKPFYPGTGNDIIRKFDITKVPRFKNYFPKHQEGFLDFPRNGEFLETLVLYPDHRFPFLPVTIGEALQRLDVVITKETSKEITLVQDKYRSPNSAQDLARETSEINTRAKQARATVQAMRAAYKGRENETLKLYSANGSRSVIALANGYDCFTGSKVGEPYNGPEERYPVYKIPPGMFDLAKRDQPLWIVIAWGWSLDYPWLVHMHQSVIDNLNVDFIYDHYFDPEKVKGKSYIPLLDPVSTPILKMVK